MTVHKLAFNSLGTRRIQDGAVNNDKLQDNAVTTDKVKDGSLLAQDFAAGQLPGPAVSSAFTTGETTIAPNGFVQLDGSGTITTTADESHLVLSGFVIEHNGGTVDDTSACEYSVGGTSVGQVTRAIPTASEVQIFLVGRTAVSAGDHTIHVQCNSQHSGLTSSSGQFTVVATG